MFHPDREYPFIPWSAGLKAHGFEHLYNEVHPETQRMTYFRDGERPRFTTSGQPIRGAPERTYIPKYPYYYDNSEFFHICKNEKERNKKPVTLKQDLKLPQKSKKVHEFVRTNERGKTRKDTTREEEEAYKKIHHKVETIPKSPINMERLQKEIRALELLERQKVEQHERKTPNVLGQTRPSSTLLGQLRAYTCPSVERTNLDGKKMVDSLRRPKHLPLGLGIRGPNLVDPDYIPYLTSTPAMDHLQISDIHRRRAFINKNDILYPIDSGIIPKYAGKVPGAQFRFGGRFGALTKNAKEVGKEACQAWGGLVSLAPSYHPPPGW